MSNRVKSGIFGKTAKFEQRPCLFHISNIGIKNKLTNQTVKILMRRLIRSRLIWIYTVCKCVSEITWCPNLRDCTLVLAQSIRQWRLTHTQNLINHHFNANGLEKNNTIISGCRFCYGVSKYIWQYLSKNDFSYVLAPLDLMQTESKRTRNYLISV